MSNNVIDGIRALAVLSALSFGSVVSAQAVAAAAQTQVPPGYSLAGTGSKEDFD